MPVAGREGPPQLSHFRILRPVFTERDVSRTDRTNKFYEGPENPGLGLLNDILLTYCMYHFDLGATPARGGAGGQAFPWGVAGGLGWALTSCPPPTPGYVQGMSDLLSPILYVIQNEVDAFWCFCGFMELVVRPTAGVGDKPPQRMGVWFLTWPCLPQHGNFEESQETMKRQLGQLLLLLRVLDPPLCDFLGECLRGRARGRGATGPATESLEVAADGLQDVGS